jgi:hypothetical protein
VWFSGGFSLEVECLVDCVLVATSPRWERGVYETIWVHC